MCRSAVVETALVGMYVRIVGTALGFGFWVWDGFLGKSEIGAVMCLLMVRGVKIMSLLIVSKIIFVLNSVEEVSRTVGDCR